MDLIAAFRMFVRVAESGSFSATARELDVGQPAVSKQIAALEAHLGARLFSRNSRALQLTDVGLALLDRARHVIEGVDEAQDLARLRQGKPAGVLRLAAPMVFGLTRLTPLLAGFSQRHPGIELDLVLDDRFVDLVGERIDLALRIGRITDESLIARPLAPVRRVAIAASSYLERRGVPREPEDLCDHDCIVYSLLATGSTWHFEGPAGPIAVQVRGPIRVNSSAGVLAAVEAGAGIGVVPLFTLGDRTAHETVRILLEDFEPTPLPMNLVYPSRRYLSATMRAAIDFLMDALGEPQPDARAR